MLRDGRGDGVQDPPRRPVIGIGQRGDRRVDPLPGAAVPLVVQRQEQSLLLSKYR